MNLTMDRIITAALAVALAVGMLVSFVGPVAAGAAVDPVLQVDEIGPLLELIARLFDISVSIEG